MGGGGRGELSLSIQLFQFKVSCHSEVASVTTDEIG